MLNSAFTTLIWTCVAVFVTTSGITLLALVGVITLGGGDGHQHNYYLRRLFRFLIIEVVIIGVGAFGTSLGINSKYVKGLQELASAQADTVASATDTTLAIIDTTASGVDTTFIASTPTVSGTDTTESVISKFREALDHLGPAASISMLVYDTLQLHIYATTDGPQVNSGVISIPSGWQYVNHYTVETTGNGRHSDKVELLRSGEQVTGVKITARVEGRSLFRPRNWLGKRLFVIVKKE